jgi:hypothetical protein
MNPRPILDVLMDVSQNVYLLWQPLLTAIVFKLVTKYGPLKSLDWLADWILVAIILFIVSTSVGY